MDERGRKETGRGGDRMVAVIQRQTEQGRAREGGREREEEGGRKKEEGREKRGGRKRTEERGRAREDGRERTEERGRKREDGRERTDERERKKENSAYGLRGNKNTYICYRYDAIGNIGINVFSLFYPLIRLHPL